MANRLALRATGLIAAAAVVGLFSGAPATAGPAQAGPAEVAAAQAGGSPYVALGDSYASGTGIGTYLNDGTICLRSPLAYPVVVAESLGVPLDFQACSGATTAIVGALQLGTLGPGTEYVSLTAGGNDVGLAGAITECARPEWMSDCTGAIHLVEGMIYSQLTPRLAPLYGAIRSLAPSARVAVAGYPRIFNGTDCNALTWFSPAEMSRLNATVDALNSTIEAAATAAGLTVADPAPAFVGHAVCDDPAWITGLSNPYVESFHPNATGHAQGYGAVVSAALRGSTVAAPAQSAPAPTPAQSATVAAR